MRINSQDIYIYKNMCVLIMCMAICAGKHAQGQYLCHAVCVCVCVCVCVLCVDKCVSVC